MLMPIPFVELPEIRLPASLAEPPIVLFDEPETEIPSPLGLAWPDDADTPR